MDAATSEPTDDALTTALYVPPNPEPDENMQHSLFGEILDWMLAPLLLLWPMSIAITYLVAKSIANQPFDDALEDRVTVLSQQIRTVAGRPAVQLPGSSDTALPSTSRICCASTVTLSSSEWSNGWLAIDLATR